MEPIYGGYRWNRKTKEHLEDPVFLEQYGYKVYSQNDEDGILQEIFDRIGTTDKRFIEFGVENGLECNCHYLLFKGWTGLWIEGYRPYYEQIQEKFSSVISTGALKTDCAFITKDNINRLFVRNGFQGDIDLLSIDVDGNDYYVWEAVTAVRPRVVCIEYNGKFPPDCQWVMPYFAAHLWQGNDNQGASLKSLELLGRARGYRLVGTNITGVNAFFVREELAEDKFPFPATAENLYNPQCCVLPSHVTGHHADYCIQGESVLSRRNDYLDKMQCTNGARRNDGQIVIPAGGTVYGPYTTIPAGDYKLVMDVELGDAGLPVTGKITADSGKTFLGGLLLESGKKEYEFKLWRQFDDVEFVINNVTDTAITLKQIYLI